eukprot:5879475-Prymnesium_polylepis.1
MPEIDPSGTYEHISAATDEIEQTDTAAARKGRGGDRCGTTGECTIEQYTMGEYPNGEPIYMDADTVGDPHDVLGSDVTLPNEMWIGFERCRSRCTGKKKCDKCKIATARTTCAIVAFTLQRQRRPLRARRRGPTLRFGVRSDQDALLGERQGASAPGDRRAAPKSDAPINGGGTSHFSTDLDLGRRPELTSDEKCEIPPLVIE